MPFDSVAVCAAGNGASGGWFASGSFDRSTVDRRGLVLRERRDFQNVDAVRQPALRRALQVGGRGRLNLALILQVRLGISQQHLAAREQIGLAAEAADALDAANVSRARLRARAFHFFRRRALRDERR